MRLNVKTFLKQLVLMTTIALLAIAILAVSIGPASAADSSNAGGTSLSPPSSNFDATAPAIPTNMLLIMVAIVLASIPLTYAVTLAVFALPELFSRARPPNKATDVEPGASSGAVNTITAPSNWTPKIVPGSQYRNRLHDLGGRTAYTTRHRAYQLPEAQARDTRPRITVDALTAAMA